MSAAAAYASASASGMYVTMRLDKQLIGIPVDVVRDVLLQQAITPIPLAVKEVAGSLNLRGRIVTVIDLRCRLNLPPRADKGTSMFVVVEHKGELYSLIVDSVGEVLTVASADIEKTPANLNGAWKDVASGIHKLSGELLAIVDIHAILTL